MPSFHFIKKLALRLLFLVLVFQHVSYGQSQNIGKLISYKKIPGGIEGKTASAIFDLHAYSEHIIRVRVSKNKSFNDFSYALKDNSIPLFDQLSVVDKGNTILLATNSIIVEIEKSPSFRVVFKNTKGEIINEDESGDYLGTRFLGNKLSIHKRLQEGERFVGMGEALGNLDKRGMSITLNNTDNYKYGDPRLPMYISVPFYIGIHHQQVYGLFYNNSYKSFFDFGLSTPGYASINFEGGDADYFFMFNRSVGKILEQYTSLTGRIALPPLWSLGYHQSRCTYYPQEKVEWIAETFRRKKIPLDCIVLDADYQQGYQPFRVNKERFPDMPGLAAKLAKMNIELTASVYPGVKIDSSYDSYTDGLKKDVFVKYANGKLFETEIAPLRCYLPDYTNPKTREWWIDKMKWLPDNGIHGYWNDMNEPAVRGSYLPDNLLFDFDGRKANVLEAKNVYGFQMARSSYESAIKYGEGRRPFILSRSGFAGIQRYAAVWSGDNMASNEGLLSAVLLNNQMGLSGIPFVGPDLGGYIGDGNKDLYRRWIEVGVFSPFVRNHREFFGAANEPWAYGEEDEQISKSYIGFRYSLMPYIYSTFYDASHTGMPIVRSLCIDYPFDDKVYDNNYQYQFLFGDALLVAPLISTEKMKTFYLPQGDWYDLFTDEMEAGGKELSKEFPAHKIPLYVKASSIIPMQSLVQSTKEKPGDTLFLHIYNGKSKNSFVYYEDDGSSMAYQKGNYCKRTIVFDPATKKIELSKQEGTYSSQFRVIKFFFHAFDSEMGQLTCNGKKLNLTQSTVPIFDALENLEDYYDKGFMLQLRESEKMRANQTITIDNSSDRIELRY